MRVIDIHIAIRNAWEVFQIGVILVILCWVAIFISGQFDEELRSKVRAWVELLPGTSAALAILFLLLTLRAFYAYSRGIRFYEAEAEVELPGSNTDMSILDLLTLKTFRQRFVRERIPVSEVHGLNNHRVTSKPSPKAKSRTDWYLIISGDFGSRMIRFASKAKRDEARTLFSRLTKRRPLRDAQWEEAEEG
jgi:hypothetical protein